MLRAQRFQERAPFALSPRCEVGSDREIGGTLQHALINGLGFNKEEAGHMVAKGSVEGTVEWDVKLKALEGGTLAWKY